MWHQIALIDADTPSKKHAEKSIPEKASQTTYVVMETHQQRPELLKLSVLHRGGALAEVFVSFYYNFENMSHRSECN